MTLPYWENKCWGRAMHCFMDSRVSVSYLEIQQGWRCSRHYHSHRANHFVVIEGEVIIDQWGRGVTVPLESEIASSVTLIPGSTLSVGSMLYHRFRATKSGKMIEVYSPDGGEVEMDDIVRFDVGGRC